MLWTLFFLLLKDLSLLHANEYHYISEKKSCDEARKYCREHYTDLATASDKNDVENILNDAQLWVNQTEAWVVQYDKLGTGSENCATVKWNQQCVGCQQMNGKAVDISSVENSLCQQCKKFTVNKFDECKNSKCEGTKPFICYRNRMILINENKTWQEALHHCRDNYQDLVSITNYLQQEKVQKTAKNATTNFVWVGMRYSCVLDMWFWVIDQRLCYENWSSPEKNETCDKAGAMEKGGGSKWFSLPENDKYNFICTKKAPN